jgi:hypothetical protein
VEETVVNNLENQTVEKKGWTAPKVTRMSAGSAETQAGNNPDGGGGAQGS